MNISEIIAVIKARAGPPESHFRLCGSGGFMLDSTHVSSAQYARVIQFFAGEERYGWRHD